MKRQTFKSGGFFHIIGSFMLTMIAVTLVYIAIPNLYVHLIWLIFVIHCISFIKNKLVIEHGMLHIEKVFSSKDEVPLVDVSEIVIDGLDTNNRTKKRKISNVTVNILGDTGRIIFKMPYSYVQSEADKQRFIKAVHAANPEIYVNLGQNY